MKKKGEETKKKRKRTRSHKRRTGSSNQSNVKIEKVLIENFVSLQHVMTNLAVKFDNLSGQISKLLELFEISAKTLAEKGILEGADNRVIGKLDNLIEQNKVLARGIALIHEKEEPNPFQGVQPQAELSKNPGFKTTNI